MMHMMSEIGGVKMPEYFGTLTEPDGGAKPAKPADRKPPPETD
jgi:hypothetical protein